MDFQVEFKDWKCHTLIDRYPNDRLAITLQDKEGGSPVARATVNLPNTSLDGDEVIIKDWSENEGMVTALREANVIEEVSFEVETGYVTAKVCKLTPEFMANYGIDSTVAK